MLDQRITSIFPSGRITVDLGCGAGELLDEIAPVYEVLVGLDISTKRLSRRARAPQDWSFVRADLNSPFPLNSEHIDTVYANQVIEHIADPLLFASEVHRILKPGGGVIVTSPNIRYIKHIWRLSIKGLGPKTANQNTLDGKWDDGHIHYFTHKDLRKVFLDAGFLHVESKALVNLTGKMSYLRKLFEFFSNSSLISEFLSGNILLICRK